MKILRHIGSGAFVLGLFTAIFVGIPWYVLAADDPPVPWWLRMAVFGILGGILLVLTTLALERKAYAASVAEPPVARPESPVLLMSSNTLPGREISEILGLVQGHTVFAVWLGKVCPPSSG